ncbi:MAG: RNA polymerase sigma factor [Anaerolineales bacterium]|nr:RNA polymerase sigma factor [Anaerolineales bacterium]
MQELSDRDLVLQLQEGSLDALGELYNRHRYMVYRTALAITGDREVASDLLQDVFLRLHRYVNHIDLERPLEPWLYRMTANQAYTWVKNNRRGLHLLDEVTEKFLGGPVKNLPHEIAEDNDRMERVQQALLELPLHQRVVVVMYYLNDLSLQEISEALDVPLGTVKSRLHYGRRALQHHMELEHLAKGHKLATLKYESS